MKKLTLFLCLALFANTMFIKAQDVESQELLKLKNKDFIAIGESNGNVFYYSWMRFKEDIKITVYKYKEETLELIDTKEVFIKDIRPKVFNDHCKIDAYFKNNKFYFFYSLLHSGDFHIGLKTFDETLTNSTDLQLGIIVETGYELLGNFFVSLSPNEKTAIVALKNFSEKKKAIGTNTTTNFENTELVYVDLINNKVFYNKRLPIEIEEFRLSTSQYKTDNEGNITFIASISDRKGRNRIHAIGIGSLLKNEEKIKISEIDVTGSASISSDLWQAKNGTLIYIAILDSKILFKSLSMGLDKKMVETNISKNAIKEEKTQYDYLFKISETENNYYLSFSHTSKSYYKKYSVAKINKSGELLWHKFLPVITPLVLVSTGLGVNATSYKNKQYVFFSEHKPYEITKKIEKELADSAFATVYDYKKFQTVMMTIDENGMVNKKVLYDNVDFESNPSLKDFSSDNGFLFLPLDGKKAYRLKKIILK